MKKTKTNQKAGGLTIRTGVKGGFVANMSKSSPILR
jgi:hypothetical protein